MEVTWLVHKLKYCQIIYDQVMLVRLGIFLSSHSILSSRPSCEINMWSDGLLQGVHYRQCNFYLLIDQHKRSIIFSAFRLCYNTKICIILLSDIPSINACFHNCILNIIWNICPLNTLESKEFSVSRRENLFVLIFVVSKNLSTGDLLQ